MIPKTIAFHHFGCKVNFAEASSLSRQFREKGYKLIDFHEKSDIYVISTCAVTAVAEKKCRAAIRQAHKLNPEARIAVIGCFSEIRPREIAKIDGVNVILGHSGKFSLLEEIEKTNPDSMKEPCHAIHFSGEEFIASYSFGDRTRSFLKIQDGCDYYCAYCTIPLARGHSRGDTITNVIANAKEIVAAGVREIVLTGVNIGDFGRQTGESFIHLIKAIDELKNIPRIRISSIEPDLLSDEIIEFVAGSDRLMPHFHIPLQSGSDKILQAMKRKYDRELYASRIQKIRSLLPYACIAADVITGFPGESDDDFLESLNFIGDIDISYMHVFTYSNRENTFASKLTEQVPDKVKKERSERLHHLSEEKKKAFYLMNKGKTANVLFESDKTDGYMHGFSENYIKVGTIYDEHLINKIITCRLEDQGDNGFYLLSNPVV